MFSPLEAAPTSCHDCSGSFSEEWLSVLLFKKTYREGQFTKYIIILQHDTDDIGMCGEWPHVSNSE